MGFAAGSVGLEAARQPALGGVGVAQAAAGITHAAQPTLAADTGVVGEVLCLATGSHRLDPAQGVITVRGHGAVGAGHGGALADGVVAVGGGAGVGADHLPQQAQAVVGVGGDLAARVSHAPEPITGVVAESRQAKLGIPGLDHPAQAVVSERGDPTQRVGNGAHPTLAITGKADVLATIATPGTHPAGLVVIGEGTVTHRGSRGLAGDRQCRDIRCQVVGQGLHRRAGGLRLAGAQQAPSGVVGVILTAAVGGGHARQQAGGEVGVDGVPGHSAGEGAQAGEPATVVIGEFGSAAVGIDHPARLAATVVQAVGDGVAEAVDDTGQVAGGVVIVGQRIARARQRAIDDPLRDHAVAALGVAVGGGQGAAEHATAGVDVPDRLRGQATVGVVGERRFAVAGHGLFEETVLDGVPDEGGAAQGGGRATGIDLLLGPGQQLALGVVVVVDQAVGKIMHHVVEAVGVVGA